MAYTVTGLSKLSGVTVRTLHFYEEIGLLKPAYYGANGYRYYEARELLQLQQILLFKQLGFSLNQIRKVLGRGDFDQLAALHSHRQALSRDLEKMGRLIETIDKTIKYVKGQRTMNDKEIFCGFYEWAQGKGGESYYIGHIAGATAAETLVLNNTKQPSSEQYRDKSYYEKIDRTGKEIYAKVASCIDRGLDPASDEVQRLVKQHHAFAEQFLTASKEVYKALAQLYREHPGFRQQLDPFHPQLAPFLAEAMELFLH